MLTVSEAFEKRVFLEGPNRPLDPSVPCEGNETWYQILKMSLKRPDQKA
jgi:hypothetical protein